MTKQSTLDYLARYDPERIYRRSPAAMLAMRAAMLQTRADQVLWAMTEADLEQASLKDKAYAYCQLSTRAAAVAEAASRSATGGQGAEIEAIMDRIKKD
jgi:hypothetical protein